MKRKSLIFIVSLVLLVFTFATAFAEGTETVTTITAKPGAQLGVDPTAAQIFDTAAIRIHSMPEGYGAFVLSFKDVDAFQSLFRLKEDGVYVQSQSLGIEPLYFSWDDLSKLLKEQLANNPDMTAAGGMFGGDMFQSMLNGSMTEEQALETMGIDAEFMAYISDIQAAQTVETGSFVLEGSDTANQKAVIKLTNDQLARALELNIVRKQMSNQVSMQDPSLTEEEVKTNVDAQLEQAKQAIKNANLNVTLTVYTKDSEFIALQFVLDGAMANSGAAESKAGVTLTLTKTTVDTAKFYQMTFKLLEGESEIINQYGSLYLADAYVLGNYKINSMDGTPLVSVDFNFDKSLVDHTTGEFALTMYDGTGSALNSALVVFDQAKSGDTTDTSLDAYIAADSMDMLKADLAKASLISLKFHTVTQPDSGFFSALQNASPETSVQLLKMTPDELNAYMQVMQQNLTMTLVTVINNLPPELSNALMQGMGAN